MILVIEYTCNKECILHVNPANYNNSMISFKI